MYTVCLWKIPFTPNDENLKTFIISLMELIHIDMLLSMKMNGIHGIDDLHKDFHILDIIIGISFPASAEDVSGNKIMGYHLKCNSGIDCNIVGVFFHQASILTAYDALNVNTSITIPDKYSIGFRRDNEDHNHFRNMYLLGSYGDWVNNKAVNVGMKS